MKAKQKLRMIFAIWRWLPGDIREFDIYTLDMDIFSMQFNKSVHGFSMRKQSSGVK